MEEISEGVICPVTEITISKDNNNNNNKKKGGGGRGRKTDKK